MVERRSDEDIFPRQLKETNAILPQLQSVPASVHANQSDPDYLLTTKASYQLVKARRILNPVKQMMPFRWTINPYRGCRHACVYCYARPTHTYYGLSAGSDFHSQIFVKTNAASLLRRELSQPTWKGETICLGSATDPYQPAERRYRLSRQLLEVLCEFASPLEIITKSPLVLDDLELLVELNQRTGGKVGVNISLVTLDEEKARLLDPGAPAPAKRLEALARLNSAGLTTRLFIMPVLPGITDSPDELEGLVKAGVEAGVASVVADSLRIARGLEDYYYGFIEQYFPQLLPRYERLYHNRQHSMIISRYKQALKQKIEELQAIYFSSSSLASLYISGQVSENSAVLVALAQVEEQEEQEEGENTNVEAKASKLTKVSGAFGDPARRSRPTHIPSEREKQATFDFGDKAL